MSLGSSVVPQNVAEWISSGVLIFLLGQSMRSLKDEDPLFEIRA